MSTRTLRSILASMLLASAMLFTAASQNVSAQPQDLTCCTYIIDVSTTIPLACFPIVLTTDWCPTGPINFTAPGPGIYVQPVPGSCPPFAPYLLTGAMPGGPAVPLGSSGTAVIGGCTVTYTVGTDTAGCIYITIS